MLNRFEKPIDYLEIITILASIYLNSGTQKIIHIVQLLIIPPWNM